MNPTWVMEPGTMGEVFVATFSATLYAIWAAEVSDLIFTSDPGGGTLVYVGEGGDDAESD